MKLLKLKKVTDKVKPLVFRAARSLPHVVHKKPHELVLNHILLRAIDQDDIDCLQDRVLSIHIRDADLRWYYTLREGRLVMLAEVDNPDVTIGGDSDAFLLLATRQEDPDTLFFQRRLSIEGDTELGLEIKNILDGMEIEQLPFVLQKALHHAGRLNVAVV